MTVRIFDRDGHEFALDQWWVKELETISITRPPTANQVRAAAVALNLARSVLPETELSSSGETDDNNSTER